MTPEAATADLFVYTQTSTCYVSRPSVYTGFDNRSNLIPGTGVMRHAVQMSPTCQRALLALALLNAANDFPQCMERVAIFQSAAHWWSGILPLHCIVARAKLERVCVCRGEGGEPGYLSIGRSAMLTSSASLLIQLLYPTHFSSSIWASLTMLCSDVRELRDVCKAKYLEKYSDVKAWSWP